MKKIYLSLSILLMGSQISMAQLTLTKAINEPVVGDVNVTKQFDSTTVIPKNGGAGQSWNFTSLTPKTYSETITYTTVASSPSAAAFPSATIASKRNSNSWELWKSSVNQLEYVGQADATATDIAVFSNTAIWTVWPLTLGGLGSDPFVATETNGTVTTNWSGTLYYSASGAGTVTLPGGNVHTNCLQVTRAIIMSLTTGTTVTNVTMMNYEYWSSSSKFPILTAEYQTATTGTNTSKSINIMVNTTSLAAGVNELGLSASNVIVFPNPAKDAVNVILPNNLIADKMVLVDINGRVLVSTENSNSVNVANIAKGVYFVRLSSKEFVLQKQVVLVD